MIIKSLLDTDYYKLTMMYVIFKHPILGKKTVEYRFKCRNGEINSDRISPTELRKEFDSFQKLKFQEDEIQYLKTLNLFDDDFLDYLRKYKNNRGDITTKCDPLDITIKGKWIDTILYEVPLLAIINEMYFRTDEETEKAEKKIALEKYHFVDLPLLNDIKFMEFGTRRRYSFSWQDEVIMRYKDKMIGTSNLYFAKKWNIKPLGTMAHEYLMCFQSICDVKSSQMMALKLWTDTYNGKLGIALTDTINTDTFIEGFEKTSVLHDNINGFRQDSGEPMRWFNRIIGMLDRMKKKGLPFADKPIKLIFSDSLDFQKCNRILYDIEKIENERDEYVDRKQSFLDWFINYRGVVGYDTYKNDFKEGKLIYDLKNISIVFGIGTYLTNNLIRKPLNIVIKPVKFDGHPVIKISDAPGKGELWDKKDKDLFEGYTKYVKEVYKI